MDFVRSYFFPNATLTGWTFLDHFFCITLGWVWCCFGVDLLLHPPKSDEKMAKKCSNYQSCIRKEITSYKIHTLDDNCFYSSAFLKRLQKFAQSSSWFGRLLRFFGPSQKSWTYKKPILPKIPRPKTDNHGEMVNKNIKKFNKTKNKHEILSTEPTKIGHILRK